jgi:putative peptidoglycan lipid II flippase
MELPENVKEPTAQASQVPEGDLPARMHRRISLVSGATFLTRIGGFLRDMIVAYGFGTGPEADLFYVGFRIPNMFRELFAEGTLSSAFIPALARTLKTEGPEMASRLFSAVGILLGLILVVLVGLGEWSAPLLLHLLAPGYAKNPDTLARGTHLIRIMFPFLFFISLSALVMGALNVQERFFLPALSPVFFSFGLIVGAFLPASLTFGHPVYGLAFGVVLGGVLQWIFQWPALTRGTIHFLPGLSPSAAFRHEGARRVLKLLLPSIGGLWVTQGNLLIATIFGSFLVSGTISALYYAMRLIQFPLGLIGAAIATVLLPVLSRQTLENDGAAKTTRTLAEGYRLSFFFMLPASAGLVALGEPLIRLLFEHGSFKAESSLLTQTALLGYAVGLWSFSGVRILVRGYYAYQDTRYPVWAGIWGLLTNLAISFLFYRSSGILALALGISAGSLVNHAILFFGLKRYVGSPPWAIFGNAIPVLLLSGGLYLGVSWGWGIFNRWVGAMSLKITLAGILAAMAMGLAFYLGAARLFNIREGRMVSDVLLKLRRK